VRRLLRPAAGEFVGSAGLAVIVVGSGIAAQRLSPADVGLQLIENSFAIALGLAVLIVLFSTVSGSHFNPVVTLADAALHREARPRTAIYLAAQVAGCVAGVWLANVMFAAPALGPSTTERSGWNLVVGEVVATAGLVFVVFALARTGRARLAAPVVGAYIGSAIFFTSSASFANPALTFARMFTDTFTGIAPASVLPFIGAELVGAVIGLVLVRLFFPSVAPQPAPVVESARA